MSTDLATQMGRKYLGKVGRKLRCDRQLQARSLSCNQHLPRTSHCSHYDPMHTNVTRSSKSPWICEIAEEYAASGDSIAGLVGTVASDTM